MTFGRAGENSAGPDVCVSQLVELRRPKKLALQGQVLAIISIHVICIILYHVLMKHMKPIETHDASI